MTIMLS